MSQNSANINLLIKIKDKITPFIRRDYEELRFLQSSVKSTKKYSEVTQRKIEDTILSELKNVRPNFGIVTKKLDCEDKEFRWILNPISNIENFYHALPFSTVSISLERKIEGKRYEAIASMIYVIGTGEAFFAEKGCGAWLEINDVLGSQNSRIRVSSRKNLDEIIISSRNTHQSLKTINLNSDVVSLSYLAAGRLDAVIISNKMHDVDISACSILVKEAGGTISFDNDGSIIATNSCCDKFVN